MSTPAPTMSSSSPSSSGGASRLPSAISNASQVVLSQYSLLRNVLDHLPAASLAKMAEVNGDWAAAAKTSANSIWRRRRPPAAFSWLGKRMAMKEYKKWPLFQSDNHKQLEQQLSTFVAELPFEPAFTISFYGGDIQASVDKFTNEIISSSLVDSQRMDDLLPPDCTCVSAVVPGIVGCRLDTTSNIVQDSFEVENLSGTFQPVASALFFPSRPDVEIVPIIAKVKEKKDIEHEENLEGHRRPVSFVIDGSDLSKIKCVIVLTDEDGELVSKLVDHISTRTKGKPVALGGAIVDLPRCSLDYEDIQSCVNETETGLARIKGLIFSGDGVDATSVVLGQDIRTKSAVQSVLLGLKPLADSNAYSSSCAFMFACCGRGAGLYKGQKKVESTVFREMFPNTPLIGLFEKATGCTYDSTGAFTAFLRGASVVFATFAMRLTPTKALNLFTALVLVILLWTVFRQSNGGIFSEHDDACDLPLSFREDLHRLSHAVHRQLRDLDLTHFLCYGSLFGQVRRAASLPWEENAEFCVLNEELAEHDEVFLKNNFKKRGMNIVYDSAEGLYEVRLIRRKSSSPVEGVLDNDVALMDNSFRGYVKLIVFARDKGIEVAGEEMLHRVGWKRRLLPPDCQFSSHLDCFPARLSLSPLPLKLFGRRAVPVPREDFELLKYHFPNNWWREEKPPSCAD